MNGNRGSFRSPSDPDGDWRLGIDEPVLRHGRENTIRRRPGRLGRRASARGLRPFASRRVDDFLLVLVSACGSPGLRIRSPRGSSSAWRLTPTRLPSGAKDSVGVCHVLGCLGRQIVEVQHSRPHPVRVHGAAAARLPACLPHHRDANQAGALRGGPAPAGVTAALGTGNTAPTRWRTPPAGCPSASSVRRRAPAAGGHSGVRGGACQSFTSPLRRPRSDRASSSLPCPGTPSRRLRLAPATGSSSTARRSGW